MNNWDVFSVLIISGSIIMIVFDIQRAIALLGFGVLVHILFGHGGKK